MIGNVNTGPFRFGRDKEQELPRIAVLYRDPETGELRPRDPNLTLDELMAQRPVGPTIIIQREIVSPDGTRRPWRPWESPGRQ